jgi:hypothetical protein
MPTQDEHSVRFEQYKLAAEMADRISSRRGSANAFYFTVSSAVLGVSESFSLAITSVAGLALAVAWWLQLRSYRILNAAKWAVINDMEASLPAQPFTDEWTRLKMEPVEKAAAKAPRLRSALRPMARYAELSVVEQLVPAVYAALFLASLVEAAA